jgi:hypothetical protein
MGRAQRLAVQTLRPTEVPAVLSNATNAILAQVIDGILWVTQPAGGPQRNYCGDPATGRRLASVTFDGTLLTADRDFTYWFFTKVGNHRSQLLRTSIPRQCR